MKNYSFETIDAKHEELDKYLNDKLIEYGISEANGNSPVYLYCCIKDKKGNIIGGIKGYAMLEMFYISQLFVEEKYRNIGLGTKLLSKIETVAINHNCNIIRLDTLNNKSHAFYIKSGYEKTVTISEYMKGFDLLFFHKHITMSV